MKPMNENREYVVALVKVLGNIEKSLNGIQKLFENVDAITIRGTSITGAEINKKGELILSMSNGKKMSAGIINKPSK